jgi:hypothetical protein
MPRRAAQVNQADVQRLIRAHQRENVPYRVTLRPNGVAIFEPAKGEPPDDDPGDLAEDL